MVAVLVGGEDFEADISLIKADAIRQRNVQGWDGLPTEESSRAINVYLAMVDDAAFGGVSSVVPKLSHRPNLRRAGLRPTTERPISLMRRQSARFHHERMSQQVGAPGRGRASRIMIQRVNNCHDLWSELGVVWSSKWISHDYRASPHDEANEPAFLDQALHRFQSEGARARTGRRRYDLYDYLPENCSAF